MSDKRFGLIGKKLDYSRSPEIHSHIARVMDLNLSYELLEVADASMLKDTLSQNFDGYNVTTPYKEAVMPLLDEIDPIAKRIGAVNTIARVGSKLVGYNTDYYGFLMTLAQFEIDVTEAHTAVVLGSGGAAKMAVTALKDVGFSEVVVVSRNPKEIRGSFPDLQCVTYESYCSKTRTVATSKHLLVNCTPIGHMGETGKQQLEKLPFQDIGWVVDLNYNPSDTLLLQLARNHGVKAVNGLKMLIAQAVKAEFIWNSNTLVSVDEVLKALEDVYNM